MKKILFASILSLVFMQDMCMAKPEQSPLQEKWVGVVWKDGEKPIVMPILSDSEKDCLKLVKEMNDITKNTIKVDRNISCQRVMSK